MDSDCFVPSIRNQNKINDLKNLEDSYDFSNLNENHELLSNKKKKVAVKFKIEAPQNFWIDEFICLTKKLILSNVMTKIQII